jgi:hypothetical protein
MVETIPFGVYAGTQQKLHGFQMAGTQGKVYGMPVEILCSAQTVLVQTGRVGR